MKTEQFKQAIKKFSAPLSSSEIEWKIQTNKNGKTIVVPYIDNRAAMQRLDDCFGAENWRNDYERWGNTKGVKCGLSVKVEDEWVTKYDGADETTIEPTKGGFSDSMKRCCTQWGLGRDLYDYPRIMFGFEIKYLNDKHIKILSRLSDSIFNGQFKDEFVMINENQIK